MNNWPEKNTKKSYCRPTDPKFFWHVTLNRGPFFGLREWVLRKPLHLRSQNDVRSRLFQIDVAPFNWSKLKSATSYKANSLFKWICEKMRFYYISSCQMMWDSSYRKNRVKMDVRFLIFGYLLTFLVRIIISFLEKNCSYYSRKVRKFWIYLWVFCLIFSSSS